MIKLSFLGTPKPFKMYFTSVGISLSNYVKLYGVMTIKINRRVHEFKRWLIETRKQNLSKSEYIHIHMYIHIRTWKERDKDRHREGT